MQQVELTPFVEACRAFGEAMARAIVNDPFHYTPTDEPDPMADIIDRIDEVLQ